MTAAVVPYDEATRNAAGLAEGVYARVLKTGMAGGAEAVARQSHSFRAGLPLGDIAATWNALPREAHERRAA